MGLQDIKRHHTSLIVFIIMLLQTIVTPSFRDFFIYIKIDLSCQKPMVDVEES